MSVKITCLRCREPFGSRERCQHCGVHKDRRVVPAHRTGRKGISRKRGRNSGKVSQHGKKK